MPQSPGHLPHQIVPAGTLSAAYGEAAPARKRAAVVLDEDSYVAAIESIIERDYFPSVPALRDRLDLLQSQRSGDPLPSTPSPFDAEKTPSLFPSPPPPPPPSSSSGCDQDPLFDDSLSLDQFMRRYTSDDNESFNRIIEKVNKKRRERDGHLLAGEQEEEEETTTPEIATKRDRITDGYGTSGQPVSTLEGWKYKARNLFMYPGKDEAPLTEEEMAERAKGFDEGDQQIQHQAYHHTARFEFEVAAERGGHFFVHLVHSGPRRNAGDGAAFRGEGGGAGEEVRPGGVEEDPPAAAAAAGRVRRVG